MKQPSRLARRIEARKEAVAQLEEQTEMEAEQLREDIERGCYDTFDDDWHDWEEDRWQEEQHEHFELDDYYDPFEGYDHFE